MGTRITTLKGLLCCLVLLICMLPCMSLDIATQGADANAVPSLPKRRALADTSATHHHQSLSTLERQKRAIVAAQQGVGDGSIRIPIPDRLGGDAGGAGDADSDTDIEQLLLRAPGRKEQPAAPGGGLFGTGAEEDTQQGQGGGGDTVNTQANEVQANVHVPRHLPATPHNTSATLLNSGMEAAWQLLHNGSDAVHDRTTVEDVPMQPAVDTQTQYLQPLLCKGFTNQVMAFVDSVMLAVQLNVTLVLPKFYKHYEYLAASQEEDNVLWTQMTRHDPQHTQAVDMSYFFDTPAFMQHMKGVVDIVEALPPWLQGDETSGRIPVVYVEGDRPAQLLPYKMHLERHRVLRTKCMIHSMTYSTPEMGRLRTHVLTGLTPSTQVVGLVEQALAQLQAAMDATKTSMFVGLHLRHESDWKQYCTSEVKRDDGKGTITGIRTVEECFVPPAEVAAVLRSRGIPKRIRVAYVASANMTEHDVQDIASTGLRVLHRGNTWGASVGSLNDHRELAAAVDFFILRLSDLFMGNCFSSFSWMVRELDYVTRSDHDTPARTFYYNQPMLFTAGDVQPLEAVRWNVLPGVLQPTWVDTPESALVDAGPLPDERCITTACQKRWLAHHTQNGVKRMPPNVTEMTWLDTGHALVRGHVGRAIDWVQLKFDDLIVAEGWANQVAAQDGSRSTQQGDMLHWFTLEVEVPVEYKVVSSVVCVGRKQQTCTPPVDFVISYSIKRLAAQVEHPNPSPILYMHFPHEYASGGPEAMHQLHNVLNKLHAEGRITVQSKFPAGQRLYKGRYSDYTPHQFHPGILSPNDYFLVPEHMGMQEPWLHMQDPTISFLPMIWFVGQHVERLSMDLHDKPAFKPLCLTEYFALQHDCGPKAILNTPMADSFYQHAAQWQHSTGASNKETPGDGEQGTRGKQNLVLYDPDDLGHFDPSLVKLPAGAVLKPLHGFDREAMHGVFAEAKVLIDSYITGMERAIFEGVLYDVVPLIAHHGAARDILNMPVPAHFRWTPWDYAELSEKLALVLHDHQRAVEDMAPLKAYTLRMPEEFEQQVLRYFGDDALVRLPAIPAVQQGGMHQRQFAYSSSVLGMLSVMLLYPFATVEVTSDSSYYWSYDVTGPLAVVDHAGYARSYTEAGVLPEYKSYESFAHYLQPPTSLHARAHVLLLPKNLLPMHPQLIPELLQVSRALRADAVFGPQGIVLVHWQRYYAAVQTHLPTFRAHRFSLALLKQVLKHAGLTVQDVPVQAITRDPHCSHVALEVGQAISEPCICSQLKLLRTQPMWKAAVSKLMPGDRVLVWAEGLC